MIKGYCRALLLVEPYFVSLCSLCKNNISVPNLLVLPLTESYCNLEDSFASNSSLTTAPFVWFHDRIQLSQRLPKSIQKVDPIEFMNTFYQNPTGTQTRRGCYATSREEEWIEICPWKTEDPSESALPRRKITPLALWFWSPIPKEKNYPENYHEMQFWFPDMCQLPFFPFQDNFLGLQNWEGDLNTKNL